MSELPRCSRRRLLRATAAGLLGPLGARAADTWPAKPLTLTWDNGQGLVFQRTDSDHDALGK